MKNCLHITSQQVRARMSSFKAVGSYFTKLITQMIIYVLQEVEQARACQNSPQNAQIQVPACFEPYGKLGSSSLEPRAYLLLAKISARATEPKPRLVPPLCATFKCLGADFKINFHRPFLTEDQIIILKFCSQRNAAGAGLQFSGSVNSYSR